MLFFFLSFSSVAWFFKFSSQLKGPARLRPPRCNGSGALIETVTSDSAGLFLPARSFPLHLRLSSDYSRMAFPLPAEFFWLADKLFVICARRCVVHTFTSSAGLFSAALWSHVCSSSDKIVALRWQMEHRGVMCDKPLACWLLLSETVQKVKKIITKVSLMVCFSGFVCEWNIVNASNRPKLTPGWKSIIMKTQWIYLRTETDVSTKSEPKETISEPEKLQHWLIVYLIYHIKMSKHVLSSCVLTLSQMFPTCSKPEKKQPNFIQANGAFRYNFQEKRRASEKRWFLMWNCFI